MARRRTRPRRPRRNGSDDDDTKIAHAILGGSARAVYVTSYADRVEDLGLEGPGGGNDWMDYAPATSAEAQQWAEELWTKMVAANPMGMPANTALAQGIAECFREAASRDGFDVQDVDSRVLKYASDFGHYIAMSAMGHGVSWSDGHEKHGLVRVHSEPDAWGIVPSADLAPLVSVETLGDEIAANDHNVDVEDFEGEDDDDDDDDEDPYGEATQLFANFDATNNVRTTNFGPSIEALSRLVEHLNYADAYENEGFRRSYAFAEIILAGLQREAYEALHPDEPRKNPRENPIIERRVGKTAFSDGTPIGADYRGDVGARECTAAQGYDIVIRYFRQIRQECGEAFGVFIVANATVDEGSSKEGGTEHQTATVDLTVYIVDPSYEWPTMPGVATRDEARVEAQVNTTLEERAEWSKENADVIFRDQLTVHLDADGATMIDSPERLRGRRTHRGESAGAAAIERALFPFSVGGRNIHFEWPVEANGELMTLRAALGGRRIATTYETWTPEDVEVGDTDNRGWEDQHGESMEPDEWDIGEGETAVTKAVKFFRQHHVDDAGRSSEGYYEVDGSVNMRTGAETRHAYHLYNFDEQERDEIHAGIFPRSRRHNPSPPQTRRHPAPPSKCRACGTAFEIHEPEGFVWAGPPRCAEDETICVECASLAYQQRERVKDLEATARVSPEEQEDFAEAARESARRGIKNPRKAPRARR